MSKQLLKEKDTKETQKFHSEDEISKKNNNDDNSGYTFNHTTTLLLLFFAIPAVTGIVMMYQMRSEFADKEPSLYMSSMPAELKEISTHRLLRNRSIPKYKIVRGGVYDNEDQSNQASENWQPYPLSNTTYTTTGPIRARALYPTKHTDLSIGYPEGTYHNGVAFLRSGEPIVFLPIDANFTVHYLGSIKVNTSGIENHPFGDKVVTKRNDPRLGSCGPIIQIQGYHIGLLITNDEVWSLVDNSRISSLVEYGSDDTKMRYINTKLIATKSKETNVDFEIVYDNGNKDATFYIGGEIVHKIHNVFLDKPQSGVNVNVLKGVGKFQIRDSNTSTTTTEKDAEIKRFKKYEIENFAMFYYFCGTMLFSSDPNNPNSTQGLASHDMPDGTRYSDENIFVHPKTFVSPDSDSEENRYRYMNWGQSLEMEVLSNIVYLEFDKY